MLRTSMDWLFRSSDGPRRKGCRRNTDAGSHLGIVIKPSHRGETVMPTAEQCNAYAAEYRLLVQQVYVSIRSAATLMAISQSWTLLADQLERLSDIQKDGRKKSRLSSRAPSQEPRRTPEFPSARPPACSPRSSFP